MKLKIFIIIAFSALSLYAAETLVGSLSAKSDNSNIRVEWRSLAENQIVKYEIERKSSSGQDFKKNRRRICKRFKLFLYIS